MGKIKRERGQNEKGGGEEQWREKIQGEKW